MTKDKIILAAVRLFLLHGYRNVSLVDVAQAVGITKGGIYHYFGSKEDLLHAAIYYLFDSFGARSAELFSRQKSFQELLKALMVGRKIELYMEQLLNVKQGDYRTNQTSLMLEVMHSFPKLQEMRDRSNLQFRNVLEQKLRKAQQQGEIRQDQDTIVLASIILSMLSGLNMLGEGVNNSAMRQQMMDGFWQLIKA